LTTRSDYQSGPNRSPYAGETAAWKVPGLMLALTRRALPSHRLTWRPALLKLCAYGGLAFPTGTGLIWNGGL